MILRNVSPQPYIDDSGIEGCRWSRALIETVEKLGPSKILFLDYMDDYQGYVDIDVLLNNGGIFSYQYSYGSCSG